MISVLRGLIYIALNSCAFVFAATEDTDFGEALTPFRGLYTNECLANVRLMHEDMSALPVQVGYVMHYIHFQHETRWALKWDKVKSARQKLDDCNVSLLCALKLCYPYTLVELGGQVFLPFNHHDIENIAQAIRCHMVFGDLHRRPIYFRGGYDLMPYGRHASAVIAPCNMVTHVFRVNQMLCEVGGQFTLNRSEIQGAVTYCFGEENTFQKENPLPSLWLLNAEHRYKASFLFRDYLKLEQFLMGGAISLTKSSPLYNMYIHSYFTNCLTWRVEYVYCPIDQLPCQSTPSALHTEGIKDFKPKKFLGRPIRLAMLLGYEYGNRRVKDEEEIYYIAVHNIFMAAKISFWNKRVQCAIGPQWNFINQRLEALCKFSVFI